MRSECRARPDADVCCLSCRCPRPSDPNTPPTHTQILESVIKFRWAALPAEQREGIKNYTSNLIIKCSTNEDVYRGETTFVNKLNLILVQILKQVCACALRAPVRLDLVAQRALRVVMVRAEQRRHVVLIPDAGLADQVAELHP